MPNQHYEAPHRPRGMNSTGFYPDPNANFLTRFDPLVLLIGGVVIFPTLVGAAIFLAENGPKLLAVISQRPQP